MKATFIVFVGLVVAVGCGKGTVEKSAAKEPELRSEKVVTPGEAANKLFVESTKLMAEAVSKEKNHDIDGAIAGYEQVVSKVRKIVDDYPESDIAVKLVSGEAQISGNSSIEIEQRIKELMPRAAEQRRAKKNRFIGVFHMINIHDDKEYFLVMRYRSDGEFWAERFENKTNILSREAVKIVRNEALFPNGVGLEGVDVLKINADGDLEQIAWIVDGERKTKPETWWFKWKRTKHMPSEFKGDK